MNEMKIAFVGIGSIGTRHLKNVGKYLSNKEIGFSIDVYRSGKGKEIDPEAAGYVTNIFYDRNTLSDKKYDVVFITNPTSLHLEAINDFKDHTEAFFIEKPVFDEVNVEEGLAESLDKKLCYVACPLRYNPVLQYVKNNIDLGKVFSVKAISSSYLPDWRPGTDYRQCYSAHADMGGGVHLDLIHEWDYLTWMFGNINQGYSIIDKVSDLEIDSSDVAVYIAKAEKAMIELHLDYFGRKAVRELTLYMPDETVSCDIQNGKVTYLKSGETKEFAFVRDDFQMAEISHFFTLYFDKKESDNSVAHSLKVLEYARGKF